MDLKLKDLEKYTDKEETFNFVGFQITKGIKYISQNGYDWFVCSACIFLKYECEKDFFINIKLMKEGEKAKVIYERDNKEIYTQIYDEKIERELVIHFVDGIIMLEGEY